MAFVTQLQAHGYNHAAAYVKAHVRLVTAHDTVVELTVWPSAEARASGAEPIRYDDNLRVFPTNLSLQSDNPVAYAYTLLEQSGEFADASWGV